MTFELLKSSEKTSFNKKSKFTTVLTHPLWLSSFILVILSLIFYIYYENKLKLFIVSFLFLSLTLFISFNQIKNLSKKSIFYDDIKDDTIKRGGEMTNYSSNQTSNFSSQMSNNYPSSGYSFDNQISNSYMSNNQMSNTSNLNNHTSTSSLETEKKVVKLEKFDIDSDSSSDSESEPEESNIKKDEPKNDYTKLLYMQ